MARAPRPGADTVYGAAQRIIDAGLRRDNSAFTPGRSIWTAATFEELYERFVEQPDLTPGVSFEEKLAEQLSESSWEACQLMAELLYLHLLISTKVGSKRKRELIELVLSWADDDAEIPDDLAGALEQGIVNPGTWFNTRRDTLLAWLIEFGRQWKALAEPRQGELLEDPWEFRDFCHQLPEHSAFLQREALLHLVHPDVFEPMVSREHKRLVVQRFTELAGATDDLDRALLKIRQALEAEYGQGFDFYRPPVVGLWRPSVGRWDEFVHWASKFYADPDFVENERAYKLRVAEQVGVAREALREGSEDWQSRLLAAFRHRDNNLTPWQAHDRFLKWVEANPEEARAALEQLWETDVDETERIRAFLELVPASEISGPGARLAIASFLLMALDPTRYPIYRPEPFGRGFALTDTSSPSKGADEADRYLHALEFLDTFIDEAASRNLELPDRLDAQGLLWCVTKWGPRPTWTEEETARFHRFRGDSAEVEDSLGQLAERLLLDAAYLERAVRLLEDKRQLIFHGPPGTGKTYVAMQLASHVAGPDGMVELVQFHPSYAYEDFVEGFRPNPQQGGAFALRDGPLKRLAAQARDNPEATHLLVIDELNRANVSRVFGELYFLLEYRDRGMPLQYSEEQFRLPSNLWFIATMNTADRSIALVDAALRRRFYFVPFTPNQPPVKGLLRRWLEAHKPGLRWLADVVDEANRRLEDRDAAIGPSHFLREDLDQEVIEMVWEHAVLPHVEEQLYGQPDRLQEFSLDALYAAIAPSSRRETEPDEVHLEGEGNASPADAH